MALALMLATMLAGAIVVVLVLGVVPIAALRVARQWARVAARTKATSRS